MPLPDNRNFLFHPTIQTNLTLYTHIVDYEISKVLVRNTSDQLLRILRRQKLGHIIDIHYDNCFLADANSAFQSAACLPRIQLLFKQKPPLAPNPIEHLMKTKLHNKVSIYRDTYTVA